MHKAKNTTGHSSGNSQNRHQLSQDKTVGERAHFSTGKKETPKVQFYQSIEMFRPRPVLDVLLPQPNTKPMYMCSHA